MTLETARVGTRYLVLRVRGQGALRRRLLDMGILKNTVLTVTGAIPLGGPLELSLRSYVLTLRRQDAALVEVRPLPEAGGTPGRRGLDRLLLHPLLALPILALSLLGMFWFSIHVVGGWTAGAGDALLFQGGTIGGHPFPALAVLLEWKLDACPVWLRAFLVEGVLTGVGTVLGFLPQLAALFFCLSFLEGCGYLARGACLLDRLLRPFGLSGHCAAPYVLACGCAVPGVLACRTIPQKSCRRLTILTASFLPCGAKLPLIALVGELAFPGCWWLAPAAYGLGLGAVLFTAWLLHGTPCFPQEEVPFLLELPPLRLPSLQSLWAGTGERLGDFLQKAASLLVLASAAVWGASSFGFGPEGFAYLGPEGLEYSLLAALGRALWPFFALCGWGDWRCVVAALSGLLAKESVVGTLAILGVPEALHHGAAALSFLLFNLFCPPCAAACAAMGQELGSRRALVLALGYQLLFALLLSLGIVQGAALLARA